MHEGSVRKTANTQQSHVFMIVSLSFLESQGGFRKKQPPPIDAKGVPARHETPFLRNINGIEK